MRIDRSVKMPDDGEQNVRCAWLAKNIGMLNFFFSCPENGFVYYHFYDARDAVLFTLKFY